MKNKAIFPVIILSVFVLLATTAVSFAQQLNAPIVGNDETISDEITAPTPLEADTNTTYHQPSGNWEGQVSEANNEITTSDSAPVLVPDVAKTTQCSDKIDNDNDDHIDLDDWDCRYGKSDNFEGSSQCSDEIDNDNDGQIDLMDSGCNNNEADNFEGDSQCSDFKDNDKDGQVDMMDPDCSSEADNFEGSFNMLAPKELNPEIRSAIDNLEVKPEKILTPIFNGIATLEVNPSLEDGKVIYHLVPEVNTPIYGANELIRQPLLDLKVNQPVKFKLTDNKIIINDEQIFDYKNIVGGDELTPLVELQIHSAITDGRIHKLGVVAGPESAKFRFIYKDKEVMVQIYSDFKIENQNIFLFHDGQAHDLKILPPEIYAAIFSSIEAGENGEDITVKDLSIKIDDNKAVYDLSVKETFKLFWFIPIKINRQYIIDSADGQVIEENKPFWAIGKWKAKPKLQFWLPPE